MRGAEGSICRLPIVGVGFEAGDMRGAEGGIVTKRR
jgi:hypothetical protein